MIKRLCLISLVAAMTFGICYGSVPNAPSCMIEVPSDVVPGNVDLDVKVKWDNLPIARDFSTPYVLVVTLALEQQTQGGTWYPVSNTNVLDCIMYPANIISPGHVYLTVHTSQPQNELSSCPGRLITNVLYIDGDGTINTLEKIKYITIKKSN